MEVFSVATIARSTHTNTVGPGAGLAVSRRIHAYPYHSTYVRGEGAAAAAASARARRARRMGGAATAGAVQRSLLRLRHAPARKRGCRRRSRAARLAARAADSPPPRRDGRSRSQPVRARPTPPLAPLRPPLRGAPIRCAPARAPIAKSRRLSAAHASHTSRARRRACGGAVACTRRGHRAENPARSAPAEAAADATKTPL